VETVTIEIPTMYGDHHVLEVRKILQEIPGVQEIYASSCFGVVQVTYDPTLTNDLEIKLRLDNAGYLGEWTMPAEFASAEVKNAEQPKYFRHTEVFETTKNIVSFAQNVSYTGRPLWPCPGMGALKVKMEE
jgi:copper chaperone CopZ